MIAQIRVRPCSRGGFFAKAKTVQFGNFCATGRTLEQALHLVALKAAGYEGVPVPYEGDESICYHFNILLRHVRTDWTEDEEVYEMECAD